MMQPQPQPQPSEPRPSPEPAPRPARPPWSRWWTAWDAPLALLLAITRPHLVGATWRERYHRVRCRQRFWRQAQWIRHQAEAQRRRGKG